MNSRIPETWTTIPLPGGGQMSFFGDEQNNKVAKLMIESLHHKNEKRAATAAKAASLPPPDLAPKECLVAFIDILGFGAEIKRAKTEDDLRAAHAKIKTVQRMFQKESASDDPDEQRELNENFGRRVIALSDAVVVVYSKKSPARSMMGGYDHFGSAISELILAQTQLILNHGIFVRGGISLGSFFFENDVLLSPAVACAYELESDHAEHPVIVLTEETRSELLKQPRKGFYAQDADIAPQAFRRHGRRTIKGQKLYFLDYLHSFGSNTDPFHSREDHEAWLAAKKERNDKKVAKIEEKTWLKSLAAMRGRHRTRIEGAFKATPIERVRDKYRWLMRYHNKAFATTHKLLSKELFKLEKYLPG